MWCLSPKSFMMAYRNPEGMGSRKHVTLKSWQWGKAKCFQKLLAAKSTIGRKKSTSFALHLLFESL